MSNTFFIQSGSLFFISGSFEPSQSISKSVLDGGENSGSEEIFITETFKPAENSFAIAQLDPNDPTSFMITGSNISASFYMSSSGKIGFGTTDPLVAFDVRADEFQIQKTAKRQGVRVNEEGNIESFNSETDAATTGSEFILTYARGGVNKLTSSFLQDVLGVNDEEITAAGGVDAFFNGLPRDDQRKILFILEKTSGLIDKASVGDVLGSIRWVAASGSSETFDKRVAGEAGNIKLTVASADNTGVTGKLSFNLPADPQAAPQQLYSINGATQKHEFTGSVFFRENVTFNGNIIGDGATDLTSMSDGTFAGTIQAEHLKSTDDIEVADTIFHSGDTDTKITFTNDDINITVGNVNMLDFTEDTNNEITFNEAGVDVDVRMEGNTDQNLFLLDAGNDKVGIGTATPGEKLEVVGNISASGIITGTINGGNF